MQACLKNPDCACFTAVPYFDTSCMMNELANATKIAKTKCVSPSEEGSFGHCSKILKGGAPLVAKCNKCTITATTARARVIRNRVRDFKKWKIA